MYWDWFDERKFCPIVGILCNVKRTTTQSNAVNEKNWQILTRNPDLRIIDDGAGHVHKMPIRTRGEGLQSHSNNFGDCSMARRWRRNTDSTSAAAGASTMPTLATRIAVEINGGVWSQGRHNRGKGYP